MDKKDLTKLLDESGYSSKREDISKAVMRIKDTLAAVPDNAEIGDLASVKEFKKKGGLRGFDTSPSALDDDGHNKEILNLLDSIRLELLTWIGSNARSIERQEVTRINYNSHIRLGIFLGVIIVAAIVAVICTVLHICLGNDKFPYGDKVAEVIGTCDFALGVLAFVIERFDDIKKTKLHNAVEDIGDTVDDIMRDGEAMKPEKVEKLVKIVKGNQKIGGFLNWGNKVINN